MANPMDKAATRSLNTDTVLATLRVELRAHQQMQSSETSDILHRNILRAIQELELHRVVSAHWPLIGITLKTRIVIAIHKLTRRLLRWYVNPIVLQQNAYNDIMAQMLRQLVDAYIDLRLQMDSLQREANLAHEPVQSHEVHAVSRKMALTDDALSATLQAMVREQASGEPPATFPDVAIHMNEPQLQLRQEVNAHWPLTGVTVPDRIAALIHKAVRRYLRWYINPIVEQQNAANAAFTDALLACIRLDAERRAQLAAYRAAHRSNRYDQLPSHE